jgi:hypothetical protein
MKKAKMRRPPLTIAQILAWAAAHHRRTGKWPHLHSGRIVGKPDQTWFGVDRALRRGFRGLAGGNTLARLLAKELEVRNRSNLPQLTPEQIVQWAEAHFQRTGRWPTRLSGPVVEAPGERWEAVEGALRAGHRGLSGGSSLARLLLESGRKRHGKLLPGLSVEQISAWAEAHYQQEGKWPNLFSGRVRQAPEESWWAINRALVNGLRGLPGGRTLARFLRRYSNLRLRTHYVPGRAQWARNRPNPGQD